METFSQRLRKLRKEAGINQTEMARTAGLARTGYAEIEHGVSVKTFEKLPKIAKKLGCRIDDLFPEMDDAQATEEGKTEREFGFDGDAQDESLDGWAM